MKILKLLSLTALIGLASIGRSSAQATGNASATATIIKPISISKSSDMSFGNIAVYSTAGTVTIGTNGSRTSSAGITLPATTPGTVTAASFVITGSDAFTYAITLPVSINITSTGNTMLVDNFTSNPSAAGVLTNGTQTISIGSTLHLAASQAEGIYTNASFPVTVSYN